MYKNTHTITELDKQIILYSKNWFGNYLDDNKIEISDIEILRHMIAKYVGSYPQHIATNDVYYWVSRLYCYLSDSGLFPELSTKSLLDRFTRVLNPMFKTDRSKDEEFILTLLGGISMIEAKGLDELGIDLGKPDYSQLEGIRHIKNGLELVESAKEDEFVLFKTRDRQGEFVLCGGSVDKVSGYYKSQYGTYFYYDDLIDVDFKDIYNIRHIKKSEIKIK
jgi:hypothetical protein